MAKKDTEVTAATLGTLGEEMNALWGLKPPLVTTTENEKLREEVEAEAKEMKPEDYKGFSEGAIETLGAMGYSAPKEATSRKKVAPKKTSPKKVTSKKTSPKKVSPKKATPKKEAEPSEPRYTRYNAFAEALKGPGAGTVAKLTEKADALFVKKTGKEANEKEAAGTVRKALLTLQALELVSVEGGKIEILVDGVFE